MLAIGCSIQVALQDAADEVVLAGQQHIHALLLPSKGIVGTLRRADSAKAKALHQVSSPTSASIAMDKLGEL